MINFSLLMVPEAKISLDGLWEKALPAVIKELARRGYTADRDEMAKAIDQPGSLETYRLEPGPATLTAAATDTGGGSIQFTLDGDEFGMKVGPSEKDQVLWMRLVIVGLRFAETYMVVPTVSDPDFTADRR